MPQFLQPAVLPAVACCLCLSAAALADDHRQLGPHEHGHGTLNLAVEGTRVSIELEAPGDDIVGFEHDPSSSVESEQVEAAKAALADPLEILGVPAAAKCKVGQANVVIEEEHEAGDVKNENGSHAHHNAFHADYSIECDFMSAFTGLNFAYFDAFKRAQTLSVTISAPKGQAAYTVTREKREISLANVM